ncbi:2-phospho-L-lactate guanylyltransferase [Methanohalophilus levihalophilus]|uniref:2-phospho-L-lactate guanylyltransferase n=1 Tax=Methanohalophilus levihalophilus TaxID=1431282 RepID=UPI001AE4D16E|nr:2-phospho-L-lactate guanylyltransferase [Methanohalophilus levihalophilus]MBP2030967.1 2-phospho-L-lactate guanylyltransferase [Methanohalophilus levihalophilus]
MRAVIPYKKENAKSRLSNVMTKSQRETFVELMLKDVIGSLSEAGITKIDILTPHPEDVDEGLEVSIIKDEADLNEALNRYLNNQDEPVLIIMADLPLVQPKHIREIISSEEEIVIVPGKGGGTNILYIQRPDVFRVKYYNSSFENHCDIACQHELTLARYDSFMASTDIDEPHDIVELILHGEGLAKEYAETNFGKKRGGKGRVKAHPLQPSLKFQSN